MIEVHIRWVANPFRGDKFAEGWASAAEAVLDYGATQWSFSRAMDGRLDFFQTALFPSKAAWERYWYGAEFVDWRRDYSSYYQVPVVYSWNDMVFQGSLEHAANGGSI